MLSKGDNVADLAFEDSDDNRYRLSDFKDKRAVVFFFYPMDFSPGCTKQACHFRDYYGEIKELGAEVFGISPSSAKQHSQFKEKYNLPYPLVPDADYSLSKTFGVARFVKILRPRRVTFVVRPGGEIVDAFHSELSMAAHAQRALEVLKRLKEEER